MKLQNLRARAAIIACLALAACVPILVHPAFSSPKTRAEATNFRETSRYADVIAFIDSLRDRPLTFGSIGKTNEGREIPYVIASNPQVRTPEEARALKRPVVYVQANIHAGEVEGKEALLALVRDLSAMPRPNVLDSIVLIAVPIYNADGNERLASQTINRTDQNGPEQVGVRANAQSLDLNRDYVKAEAPETRASLAMFSKWNPDVFVDLHTTDGSYHGYALTYAPPLNPAAPLGSYARDSLLPVLRSRMKSRHSFDTFDYGDFISEDTLSRGWATFDSRPRFGTNYFGLRGGISILSEAFSHDPFEKRIASTYAFTREILSLAAERAGEIMRLSGSARRALSEQALIPIRSKMLAAPDSQAIPAEVLVATGDTLRSAPGVRKGFRRTGRYASVRMPVFDRFTPTLTQSPPGWYVFPASDTATAKLLMRHGISVGTCCASSGPVNARIESFVVDSVVHASRLFQGHFETRLTGVWREENAQILQGWHVVAMDQPLSLLAIYLLEPQSDDGLVTWNHFDAALAPGREFPVRRAFPKKLQ